MPAAACASRPQGRASGREYAFLSTWLLECERAPVWEVIFDQRAWPSWWRGLERVVEIDRGDEIGIGAHSRLTWRARLPYSLVFEAKARVVDAPYLVVADVSGELTGTGSWRLYEQGGTTAVLYQWNVALSKRWMSALGPALTPIFRSNHDWVMRNGGEGIAEVLGCRLLASS